MANSLIERIYQTAFEDELEKIAGVPRYGLGSRVFSTIKERFDRKKQQVQDFQIRKSRAFKKWTRKRRKQLRMAAKNWRKQHKLKLS